MAEVVLGAVSIVSGCLVAPVDRLCGHVISYDSDVRELDREVEKLGNARNEVQRSIREARNNMKPIKAEVEKWLREVETVTNEARDVLDYDRRAEKTCFYGWLPNLKVRYHLSRKARRKAKDIQGLIGQIPPGEVYDDPPPGLVVGASDMISSAGDRGDTNFDSRASILEDIVNALVDKKNKVIGIYGEGGVGKTTLLEQVNKKLRNEKRLFHMIVKANVSQNPDFKKIQEDIADDLGLKSLKDVTNEERRKELLFNRLQNPSEEVLIIMDDLWKDLDLRKVGIPSRDVSKGCKLLLTSRNRNVLEQTECHDSIFRLERLKDDEAFRLFEKTVGDRLKDKQLKTIADQLVKKLAGLPLLINSVAKSLKERQVAVWRNALTTVDPLHIETIVKWSYDHLKSENTKTLFLLCGLIGGTIQVEILLGLGMGLGLFEESRLTMQESRNRLYTMLDDLRLACLLLDGGDDKDNVTIHDLYSEAVISTPFRGQNSLMMNNYYGFWSKEKLEKCWAICLTDVDKKRLDELMKCQFPDLKILMLSQPDGYFWPRKQEHEREVGDFSGLLDFTYMKELRVLYFCSMHIASLPPSIGILGNLHSLYLDHCNVQDMAILGKLKALQILTIAQDAISRLPKEIGELTNLRSLNLSKCNNIETIEPGVLNHLTNLEELHIFGFSRWMDKDQIPSKSCNARLAELKSLTKLAFLDISISDPMILLEAGDLPFKKLKKFWINVGNHENANMIDYEDENGNMIDYEGLTKMTLNLEGRDSILSIKWVQENLQETQCLHLRNLSEFEESPRELCTQGFQEVKYLHIEDSPSIKYIADLSKSPSLTAFGKLESFILNYLINLEKICHGPTAPECFNKLKAVKVVQCNQLKYLWRLSNVQSLKQLEEIEVWNCDSMQSIVTHEAGEDIVSTNNRVELPNVRRLHLLHLPNMTSFCHTSIQVSLPHLESLVMSGLLGSEEILCSEHLSKYSNLRRLVIVACKSTSKSILKLDWILKLPNLESMDIENSPSAEVVFDLEELEVIEVVEILSRLTKLTFKGFPNLQCVCKQDVKLQGISILRNLRDLCISETGLSFLFSVSIAKCLREIRTIEVLKCPNMKAVIVDEEGRNEGTYDIIEFPLLNNLLIWQCPMEKFFSCHCGKKEPVTITSDSQDANSDSFFDQKVTFPNIRRLRINGLQCKELWNNQIPTNSSLKLKYLGLEDCDNLQRIATSYMWKKLQCCLKELEVISCPLIEIIYEGDGTDTESGKLRRLNLDDLKNLRCIWQSDSLPNIPFPNLRNIQVTRCPRLEMIFPTFTAKFLGQIERLVLWSCEDMELIAGHEKGEGATHTTITFSELTILTLVKLPKFKRFFLPEKYSLKFPCSEDFPSLRHLRVESCGAEPDQVLGDSFLHPFLRSAGHEFMVGSPL